MLNDILDAYDQADDAGERRKLLAKATVLGAYIKRRGNLVLLREQNESLPTEELALCLNESIQNLELMGATCELTLNLTGVIDVCADMRIYDVFEAVAEAALDSLLGIWVHISEKAGDVAVHIEAVSDCDLSALAHEGIGVTHEEDGAWSLSFRLPKGGAGK